MINLEPVGRMVSSRRSVSTVFAEEAPYLKMLPSEYNKSGRVYFALSAARRPFPTACVGVAALAQHQLNNSRLIGVLLR